MRLSLIGMKMATILITNSKLRPRNVNLSLYQYPREKNHVAKLAYTQTSIIIAIFAIMLTSLTKIVTSMPRKIYTKNKMLPTMRAAISCPKVMRTATINGIIKIANKFLAFTNIPHRPLPYKAADFSAPIGGIHSLPFYFKVLFFLLLSFVLLQKVFHGFFQEIIDTLI